MYELELENRKIATMTVYTLSKAYIVLQETLFQDRYFVMNLAKRYWTAILCRTPVDSCYCILLNVFFVCEKSWIYVNVALFHFRRYICWREIFDAYSNFLFTETWSFVNGFAWHKYEDSGAQQGTFRRREGFLELGHFDKRFMYGIQKKDTGGKKINT